MVAVTIGASFQDIDVSINDVKPPGATCPYASMEQLRSLQLQFEGAEDDAKGVLINGCLADTWSCGCILYEMLASSHSCLMALQMCNRLKMFLPNHESSG